jgi:2-hydroxychromene-2-carboxylate isomerase
VIPGIEKRTSATFSYVPILLGGLFKLTGNQSPATAFAGIRNKPEYERLEMQRFISRHGITDFRMNPHFPINTLLLMRGAVAARQLGVFDAYVDRVFDDMWTRELDMGQPEVVARSLGEAGLPVEQLFALAQTAEVKQGLLDNTQTAFEKGAFGSPSFLVNGDLYFGKDRLRDVEEAIATSPAT